ncbi:MAG TPA: MBL fold metallo-hydrolase [Kaistiaceae bacterium]|nr:MBL fold metallo-hydrolase [Kaistiaceae bacterium]
MTVLKFHGAARTVTGSCHLVEAGGARLLVDCGMYQGSKTMKALNYRDFPFDPRKIDAVILTHAHIDHSGLLPKLCKAGFKGRIAATRGTIDLCAIMLPDSGHIQEFEVELLNRRNRQRGRDEVVPIYTAADAIAALNQFRLMDYDTWFEPVPGIRARFWNAGHILGSASVEMEIAENDGTPLRLLFSGDIGPDDKLLHPDPDAPAGFDYVVCESTYGDTDRPITDAAGRREHLAAEIRDAYNAEGALLIPAFAVERTQELILDIVELMQTGAIPEASIFVDSPLAIRATRVFAANAAHLEDGHDFMKALHSKHLRFAETVEESKAIAGVDGFKIILSASGMCEAGRIRHHLKRWLYRHDATVLMVGYQAEGTLGRLLLQGERTVRIQGEEIKVAARIREIDDYSGHADGRELAEWIAARQPIARGVFLVHGEENAQLALERRLARVLPESLEVLRPVIDDAFALRPDGPKPLNLEAQRRIKPEMVARLDWHNDLSKLILDISDRLDEAADDRARDVVIRRIRRALEEE